MSFFTRIVYILFILSTTYDCFHVNVLATRSRCKTCKHLPSRNLGIESPQILNGFDNIDAIFVVHLQSRKDRLEQINDIFSAINITKHKIVNAVPHSCPPVGCSLSHIMALAECMHLRARTCLILEDDFDLSATPVAAQKALNNFFNNGPSDWDVLLVSGWLRESESTEYDFLKRVRSAQTASGYIVNEHYVPVMLQNFLESSLQLNKDCGSYDDFALDQYWKRLQGRGQWYAFSPLLGRQRPSYSDIEKREVDYKV